MEKKTMNEGIPKHITPRERAEKEAKTLMCYGRYTEEGFADFIERILNEAITAERQASKVVDTVFGSVLGVGVGIIADHILKMKSWMEIERKACIDIAEEIRKRELRNYTGANCAYHTIAEEIRDNIRARGEKKDQSAR